MSETLSPDTPRQLLTDLGRLVTERASVEKAADSDLAARRQSAEQAYREAQAQLDERHRTEQATAEKEHAATSTQTAAKYEADRSALEKEYETARKEALARASADEKAAEQALQDAHWKSIESSDAARGSLNLPLAEVLAELDGRWNELAKIHQQAANLLYERGTGTSFPQARRWKCCWKSIRGGVLPMPWSKPAVSLPSCRTNFSRGCFRVFGRGR